LMVIVPPSNRPVTWREKSVSNSSPDWVHSVIARAALLFGANIVWKPCLRQKRRPFATRPVRNPG
jgi:hypothetical protein